MHELARILRPSCQTGLKIVGMHAGSLNLPLLTQLVCPSLLQVWLCGAPRAAD